MMKIIGIVGSRRRNSDKDFSIVEKEFLKVYEQGDCIVSGGCPKGADRFAEIISKQRKISIFIHSANWKEKGRIAGFTRNTLIARDSDVLIACVASDRTGGTEHTIKVFQKLGKKDLIIC